MSGDELRRRAQPILDRAPYDALPIDALLIRARARRRRSQRATAALAVVAIMGIGLGVLAATSGSAGPGVKIRTTTPPEPSSTVPASTTIADLGFTPIAGPDGTQPVEIFAAGDHFLAVPRADDVTRLWVGDTRGRWTSVPVPEGLLHRQLQGVQHVGDRYYVLARDRAGVLVFDGPDLAHLRASNWKILDADLPRAMDPAPPRGKGIVIHATAETAAVNEVGVVLVGRVTADFDVRVLPRSVREQMAKHPEVYAQVTGGRVIVRAGYGGATVLDRSARSLGIGPDVIEYLEGDPFWREQTAVWGAGFGHPVRRLRAQSVVDAGLPANPQLSAVAGGFFLKVDTASAAHLWWSRDGDTWRALASPPHEVQTVVDLGARWVLPITGVESDDEGHSWVPIDVGRQPSAPNAPPAFGASGTPGFGIFGAATPIDASTVTTYASRLYYSPDGVQWSSLALDDALHFDSNIPSIAVGATTAIVESGRHALGPQPQRFWLVTVSP